MNTKNMNTPGWRYAAPARLLHWLMAVLIPAMLALGWTMMEVEDDPGSDVYFNLHKSLGLLLLLLLAARAAWRLSHRPADLPPSVICTIFGVVTSTVMPSSGILASEFWLTDRMTRPIGLRPRRCGMRC